MTARAKSRRIRDRVVALRRVKASDLIPSPHNWRTHPEAQRAAIRDVLAEIGYAGAALARETKAGPVLIDGHLRAETTPDEEIPVLVLDVTEAEAKKLIATYDPLAAMAEADADKLESLLEQVRFEGEAATKMLADMVDVEPLTEGWGETPENKNGRPNAVVAHLGIYVGDDLDSFETLLADAAREGERPIDTIKRGLDAINSKRPK